MPYSDAVKSSAQILTPPWYTWGDPGGMVINAAEQFYKYFWPAPGSPGASGQTYDALMNAATGRPTDAQIAVNTAQCVAAIQKMRQTAPNTIPAGVEDQCAKDQQAYTKLIGGTAEDVLGSVIPSPSKVSSAIWILALAGLGIYLVTQ